MRKAPRSLPSRQSYDALVFGTQIPGAIAAALLARRGHRVLAVTHGACPLAYRGGGFLLPSGPAFFPALRSLPSAVAVLAEISAGADVQRLAGAPVPVQVLAARMRLTLALDARQRAAELSRELGELGRGAAEEIDALLAAAEEDGPFFAKPLLPPCGIAGAWRVRRALRAHPGLGARPAEPRDSEMGGALSELWRLGSGLLEDGPSSRAAQRPLAQLLRGVQFFPGGAEGLAAELFRRVEAAGGTVLGNGGAPSAIEGLDIEKGRIVRARIEGSPHEWRASFFVAALDAAELRDLLPARAADGRLGGLLSTVKPHGALLSQNLVVSTEGLPPGLGPVALCLTGEPSIPALLVQTTPALDEQGKESGAAVLQLSFQLPATLHSHVEVRAALSAMRRAAAPFLPFHERHVHFESSPQLEEEDGLSARLRIHPRLEIGRRGTLGVTGLPARGPIANLVLASREVLPGLGFEGEFLAGLRAAQIVAAGLPKKPAP